MKKGLNYLIIGIILVLVGAGFRLYSLDRTLSTIFISAGLICELIFVFYFIDYLRKKN